MIVLDDCKEYDLTPEEAHNKCRFGVQFIVQTVPGDDGNPRREVLYNFEFYFYDQINSRWRGTHSDSVALFHHSNGSPLLHASMMPDRDFARLRDKHLHAPK